MDMYVCGGKGKAFHKVVASHQSDLPTSSERFWVKGRM